MIDYDMPEFLPTLSVIMMILVFVLALGLYMLLVFMRRPKKDIVLYGKDGRQNLEDNEAQYFTYIKYDAEKNAVVLKQSQVFKKCVVTLIYKKNGSLGMKKYTLNYNSGDLFCGIQLEPGITDYKVVLESVDGTTVKHDPIDSSKTMNIVYAALVSLIFIIWGIVYIVMWSYSVYEEDMGIYGIFYGYLAVVVVYFGVIVGGYFLGELLSKKGAF